VKALIFVSVLWAFSFGLIKGELTSLPPSLVAALRLLICTLIFLPFIKFNTPNRVSIKLLALGVIQFGIMYWAYIQSYQYLPGYLVAVFTIFTPIYVYLTHSVLTKSFSFSILVVILSSIIGAGVIVYKAPDSSTWLLGFVILQCANLAFALGQVGYKQVSNNEAPNHLSNMATMYVGAAIFMMIVLLIEQSYVGIESISTKQWLILAYLGAIASGLGFAVWNYGAKQVSAQNLAVMNNGYIPFAVLFSLTIFNEEANLLRLLIGASIMLLAISYLVYKHPNENTHGQ